MSIFGSMAGRKAYMAHIKGNRFGEMQNYREAEAQHALAIRLYEEAIQKGMAVPSYLMAYSVLLLRVCEYEKARDTMLKVEKMKLTDDQKRQLRQNYAICLWKMGELNRAIEILRPMATDKKNSWLYGSLGYMLIEKAKETGEYGEALAFNMEGFDYDDEDAVVLDNLGQLHFLMGERDKAREYFETALKFKPYQVDTHYYLALMAHQDGEDAEAREHLDTALKGNYTALCTTTREQAQALLGELAEANSF